ncbi:MAG: DUF11 domain-containing protein [Gammaproteobacteria bacterium]|nr:DUF11 domain-containing protein [Gammaproteobacteria bacterium]MBL6999412.1 DUF11 domain-containing protein [Gammaproteobacteria bacterium]
MRQTISRIVRLLAVLSTLPAAALGATDLAVSAQAQPSPLVLNGNSFVTATFSNLGSDAAQDVVVTSTLPAGLNLVNVSTTLGNCSAGATIICNLGTLNAGNLSVQASVTLEINSTVIGSLNTSFSATSSTPDADALNNNASATLEVVALSDSADLAVAYNYPQSYDVNGIWSTFSYSGLNTTFPLLAVNNGPAGVSDATLDFSIPQRTLSNFISASAEQGSCSTALNNCAGLACISALQLPLTVHCAIGALSAGTVMTVDIVATITGVEGTILQTSARVNSATADADPQNNTRGSTIQILPEPSCGDQCESPPGCFIATAAYGSEMQAEVQLLRQFRDQQLLTSGWGRHFVAVYYRYSPALARYIAGHDQLRMLVRGLLFIPLLMITYPLPALALGSLLMLLTLRRVWAKVKKRRQRILI